jgi:hypothetical protein
MNRIPIAFVCLATIAAMAQNAYTQGRSIYIQQRSSSSQQSSSSQSSSTQHGGHIVSTSCSSGSRSISSTIPFGELQTYLDSQIHQEAGQPVELQITIIHGPTNKEICKGTLKSCRKQLFEAKPTYNSRDSVQVMGTAAYHICK